MLLNNFFLASTLKNCYLTDTGTSFQKLSFEILGSLIIEKYILLSAHQKQDDRKQPVIQVQC